jgi:hypothetical protein
MELSDLALLAILAGLLVFAILLVWLATTNEYRVEVRHPDGWRTEFRTASWRQARELAWEMERVFPGAPIRIYDCRQERYFPA